jgi:hypothetical protein
MTTTTTVAILGIAPCGHAVTVLSADPAHAKTVGDAIEGGRRRGLEFILLDETPGAGALQPSCEACRVMRGQKL